MIPAARNMGIAMTAREMIRHFCLGRAWAYLVVGLCNSTSKPGISLAGPGILAMGHHQIGDGWEYEASCDIINYRYQPTCVSAINPKPEGPRLRCARVQSTLKRMGRCRRCGCCAVALFRATFALSDLARRPNCVPSSLGGDGRRT